jgi:hypothetical protein
MALGISTTVRNSMLNQIEAAIDAGGAGTIKIYDGSRPATGGTATTLLVTLTFSATSAPAASGGVLTFNAITNGTAVATSTATWARISSGGGTFVFDCNVGTSVSDINLNATSISTGLTVSVTSATITAGNP